MNFEDTRSMKDGDYKDRNSKNTHLKDPAFFIMHHIICSYNIDPSNFPAILALFTALLLGQPPHEYEIHSSDQITARLYALHEMDMYNEMKEQEERITKLSKHGFPTYTYSGSDDTL